MAIRKVILDFRQQPIVGAGFEYSIYINGVILDYTNTETKIDVEYVAGSDNAPFEIGLGADLDETIDNTLAFLIAEWGAASTAGGYLTSISYARVGDTIEATIDTTAPFMYINQLVCSEDYIKFNTPKQCSTIFLFNYPELYGTPTVVLWNTTLNIAIASGANPNNFNAEVPRGFNYQLRTTLDTILTSFSTPPSISESNVIIYLDDNTANINVSVSIPVYGKTYPLDNFLYSLNGTDWQESNVFEDLESGEYTVYIKDDYGCVQSFAFTNLGESNTNIVPAYTYISESNSLRFVKRVDWGNCSNYKNVFNTLSFEENTKPANKFIQRFQSCDTITTQVKTSYENVEVAAGETEITANKIVSNIGVQDKRDCFYYNFEGNLAVLYLSGNIYAYDTTDIISTYELNGQLPEYGVVGNYIETDFGTFQIINIRIDDNGQRSLILNSIVVPDSGNENGTIQTIYNRDTYDVWEFVVPMNDFLNETFKVGVRFYQTEPSESFPDVIWISECIQVKERFPYSKKIVWKNSMNTDVYYFSGIEMMGRFDFCQVETNLSDGEVEIQKTDSQVLTIDNTDYKAVQLNIQYLTTGMVRKMKLAVKHDYLIIEDVAYVLAESPDITRLEPSNFYTFTAKLLEAGDIFNTGTANTQTIVGQGELIGLLSGDDTNEYVRIK